MLIPDIIDKAADYIETGWAAGNEACDKDGENVAPDDVTACAWSVEGAVELAASGNIRLSNMAFDAIKEEIIRRNPGEAENTGSGMAFASDLNWDASHSNQVVNVLRAAAEAQRRTQKANA